MPATRCSPRRKSLPNRLSASSSAPRRCGGRAQLLFLRPDLLVVPLRGNVETRLRKLAAGEADATLLAVAGLKRLGLLGQGGGKSRQR